MASKNTPVKKRIVDLPSQFFFAVMTIFLRNGDGKHEADPLSRHADGAKRQKRGWAPLMRQPQ
jgi:hypothetical protein